MVGAPAAVEWPDPTGGRPRALPSRVTLDLHLRPGTRTASLRLRAPIVLKGPGRRVTPLFFYIPPERIDALAFVGPADTRASDDVQKALLPGGSRAVSSGTVVSLRVRLMRPGDLVAPPVSPVLPMKKTHWDLFDALRSLAQAFDFVVYWGLDKSPKSEESVRDVARALSAGQFTASLLPHADISRLYEGKGGRLLTGPDLTNKPAPGPVEPAEPGPPAPPIEEGKTDPILWSPAKRLLTQPQQMPMNLPSSPPPPPAAGSAGEGVAVAIAVMVVEAAATHTY